MGDLRVLPRSRSPLPAGFELGFVHAGAERRLPLAEAVAVPFEQVAPVRSFPSYRGQRNYPGCYYAACLDAHVEFESWLERDEAMVLDFEPTVAAFAAQPFWLSWPDEDRVRSHAPDFFARHRDGGATVVDCRPAERIKPRDAAAFTATERACALAGWEYRLVTGHDPVWLANVRWLAGYRHRRYRSRPLAEAAFEMFAAPRPLMEGAVLLGDPIAVLPTLYHLLWVGELQVGLRTRLEATSLVARKDIC